ncbi:MAG TPA: pyridoxal phosphate-dependent aminotransferase [Bryobacteraceae bacterium]|jgi:aspartate/methionine/tyrosine aminotransferase
MKPASSISRLGVEGAFDVLSRARALEAKGQKIIHLEIGEPDFPTPPHIVEAAKRALDEGYTHYGPTMGLPVLREAIAKQVTSTRAMALVDPSQVGITPGAKPALFFAMLATLEPGDEVLLPDPGFPIYASLARYLGAVPVPVPLVESRQFSFDLNFVEDHLTPRTKMLILNSPHNPTGGVIAEADIRELARLLIDRDIVVISDEIYRRISFEDEPPFSIASIPGMETKTIIIDGFSKSHAMTGWRLGYGIYPTWLTDAVSKLVVNSNSCTATFVQMAGLAAVEGPQTDCERMVAEFRKRRDAFVSLLTGIAGFNCTVPHGAFYAYPSVAGIGTNSKELEDALLTQAGVACLSGSAFGLQGSHHLRFSMANSLPNLQLAAHRISEWSKTSSVRS